jgi:phage shock protein A
MKIAAGGYLMGIFTRFRDIVASNINGMLDRAEDPEKLIKLMIQEMEDTLIELKSACAGVMAERKKIETRREVVAGRVDYWAAKAELAVSKGRDDLAREALVEKRRFSEAGEAITAAIAEHEALLDQYKADIDQLEEKLKSAYEKQRILVQRHIHARRKMEAQEDIRHFDSIDTVARFEEFEKQVDRMEAEADLVHPARSPELKTELEKLSLDDEIEGELQALKTGSVHKMEARVEALETILEDRDK